jgi:ribonuclease E
MEESKNRREVENRLRDALRQDRARVQFGTISKFGLMEMSRQRLKPALSEGASIPCPRCGGAGHIRDTESSALQILRIIQEESMKDNTAAVHAQVPVEVAAFLLNEKRPEIAKIELQQRISVLLVPNKSLETPHYKLERLKHDDPRLDRIEASYKMAEEIEDATTVTRRSQEPTNKQTPVIKGVLPDAPAPVAPVKVEAPAAAKPAKAAAPVKAAAASGGFFGWLKRLFGGSTEEAKPAVADKKDEKTREGRNGERNGERREGGRDGRRGGRDGRRGERAERPEGVQGEGRAPREGGRRGEGRNEVRDGEGRPARGERSERPAGERQPREGRRERGENNRNEAPAELAADGSEVRTERTPRAERGERGEGRRERGEGRGERGEGRRERGERRNQDKAPGELNAAENAAAVEGQEVNADNAAPAENNGERRERRSRDRYGRDRRERNGETRQDNDAPTTDTAPAAAPAAEAVSEDRPAPRSYFERAQQAAAEAAPQAAAPAAEAAPAPAAVMPAAVPAQVITQVSAAPAASAPTPGLPKVASYTLPLDSLQEVAQSSGLVWVNSDADKIAAVQAAIAAEPKPVHVPRERPPAVVVNEGPLVLVETRKDLKNMNLPF